MNTANFLRCAAVCGIATLAVASFAPTAAAAAEQFVTGSSTKVRFGDLNLAKPEGAAELYRRINAAARRVCGDSSIREMHSLRAMDDCQRVAIAKAVKDVNNAHLTALHNGKGGKSTRVG